jgi:predicted glycosyltransferase
MRILYHAIDGIGLGHLMRLSAIAAAVRRRAPDVHQLIVTSANYPPHFRSVKIPVLILPNDDTGPFIAPDRRVRSVTSRFESRLLGHAIDEYDPRAVVFDTHAPRWLVEKVAEDGRQAFLVYRACREEYVAKSLKDGFFSLFDLVLIPHDEAEFRSSLDRATFAQLMNLERARFVGPIVYPAAAPAHALDRYVLTPADQVVVVTAGAGGLGRLNHRLFKTACDAAVQLRRRRPLLKLICVGGPYGDSCDVPDGCTYVNDEPYLQALIGRADVVIAVPSYNTVQEILHAGARAIFVPVERKYEDLEARTRSLVHRGRAKCLPANASASAYAQCIDALLQTPRPVSEPCAGAANAAEHILDAAHAPRRFTCTSPAKLARALQSETSAIVRIDWRRVEKLFNALTPSAQSVIAGLEIALGRCDVDEAVRRTRVVYEFLEAKGFDTQDLLFSVDDPSDGRLLAALTTQIRELRFKALVARMAWDGVHRESERIFENLERCRDAAPQFKIDITVLDEGFVFVDQP